MRAAAFAAQSTEGVAVGEGVAFRRSPFVDAGYIITITIIVPGRGWSIAPGENVTVRGYKRD